MFYTNTRSPVKSAYSTSVKQIWTGKAAQVAAKYGETAPAVACCNACRTCVQTNLVGIALGAVAALGPAAKRIVRRA